MGKIPRIVRDVYGATPLHLLTMATGFAVFGYVLATVGARALWNPHTWWQSIAVWFAGAIILHDLVLFPLYSAVDRILPSISRRPHRRGPLVPALNYLRVPALGSGLMLLVFFPGVIQQGAATYRAATGQTQQPFFARWLLVSAAMFGVSALAYGIRLAQQARGPAAVPVGEDDTVEHERADDIDG